MLLEMLNHVNVEELLLSVKHLTSERSLIGEFIKRNYHSVSETGKPEFSELVHRGATLSLSRLSLTDSCGVIFKGLYDLSEIKVEAA